MLKIDRNYALAVSTSIGTSINIAPPFTLEFDIQRKIFGSANGSSIKVTNLSQRNRDLIRKNRWDRSDNRPITLLAGYGNNLSKIFSGSITEAFSVRPDVDFITEIQSFDAGFAFANSQVALQFPEGTPFTSVLEAAIATLPGVTLGAIGNYPGNLSRGNSYSGSATDILTELTGGGFFIDNGKAYCLKDNEVITGSFTTISSDNGLLGTPIREEAFLNFDMMFEPRLILGQKIKLQSTTGPKEARQTSSASTIYKVVGLSHRGIISPTTAGTAITSVQLYVPPTAVPVKSNG